MEKIRCFSKTKMELRPLTLLLGENSTGKSTALGCLQTVLEVFRLQGKRGWLPFNEQTHSMGTFQNLVRGLSRDATPAVIERDRVKLTYDAGPLRCELVFAKHHEGRWVVVKELKLSLQETPDGVPGTVEFHVSDQGRSTLNYNKRTNKAVVLMNEAFFSSFDLADTLRHNLGYIALAGSSDPYKARPMTDSVNALGEAIARHLPCFENFCAPPAWPPAKRFYEIAQPGPSMDKPLAVELWDLKESKPTIWAELAAAVNATGRKFDLFSDFYVVPYNGSTDRVSLTVVRDGLRINVCDVGFGIWQALHQLIRLNLASIKRSKTCFMLQQADIHGHPRLHAEMTSQYCRGVKEGHHFIIETHSDYVLNRISIEICKGTIRHQDVALAYFTHDRRGHRCKLHNLRIDHKGDVEPQPRYFKRFFFDETRAYVESTPST